MCLGLAILAGAQFTVANPWRPATIIPEFFFEIAFQRIPGYSLVNKFGHNAAVGNGTFEDVWSAGGRYPWPTAAVQLEAISTSTDDDDGGTGAQIVKVYGLDGSLNEINETITMNGTSASTVTTQSFFRVFRAYVTSTGTYVTNTGDSNAGTITVRAASAGATLAQIAVSDSIGVGQSQLALYTVPAGHTGLLKNFTVSIDASKPAKIYLWRRPNADDVTTPYDARRLLWEGDGIQGDISIRLSLPVRLEEKTDVWFSAIGSGADTSVSAEFDIVLAEN